jgi:DNA-binding MarR family transcriptional regulator
MDTAKRLLTLLGRLQEMRLTEPPVEQMVLSIAQIQLIQFIHYHYGSGCHMQEIAEGLNLSAPTVSVAIRRLESDGWLERKSDPDDKRAFIIQLTEKSEKAISKMMEIHYQAIKRFLAGLTSKEQEELLALLSRAIDSAESRSIQESIPGSK